jgi:tetrahydromethanopterin S-methyltransferase subunit A
VSEEKIYPWGGKFVRCDDKKPVAVVTLSETIDLPKDKVAVYGPMKTENLGVEKVVANVISNPFIRHLIVCGREVQGHRSGDSIVSLHKNGLDETNRVVGAKSAIPYIENIPREAVERFRRQVEVINLIGVEDQKKIMPEVEKCLAKNAKTFGEPYITPHVNAEKTGEIASTDFALHSRVDLDPWGVIHAIRFKEGD